MEHRNSLIEQLREHLSQSDIASLNTYESGVSITVLVYKEKNSFVIYTDVIACLGGLCEGRRRRAEL